MLDTNSIDKNNFTNIKIIGYAPLILVLSNSLQINSDH